MELYPVYRPSLVTVQSNIDSKLANPDLVRSLGRADSGDQISLEVKAAEEVEGTDGTKYDFVGWSRDYVNDGQYSPHKVRYHGVDGSVIFTATVDSDDERATGAGFVHDVDVPKMDEGGNPVFDDKGDPVMEQKSVAYDPDAYSKIVAQLDGRAATSGDVRELFLEWRYVGADGTAKSWNGFKGEPITGDMDLYPVTYRVTANDTSDAANPVAMTAKLKWLLDPTAANTVDDNADKAPFKVCFAEPFMGTQLTVTVKQASYGPNASVTEEPVNGKLVSLYSLGSGNGSFDLANRLDSKTTGEGEQGDGNAVFDFAKTHALTIVKKTTDANAMGQTFRFKVTKTAEGASPETRVAEVKVDKRQQENGETWYVGVNTRAKDKWVDGGSRAKNVWENGTLRRED